MEQTRGGTAERRPGSWPGQDGAPAGGARAAATFGLAVVAAVVAVVAAVAMALGRGWLGQRVLWGVGLVVVSLVVLWWRPRVAVGAVWASVFMVVGGLVIATDLSSASDPDFDQRVLADDLPPVAVYVAAIGLGVSTVAAAVVAALRPRARPLRSRRRAVTVAGIGGVAAVVLMAAAVPVGAAIRSAADRRAEAEDLTVSRTTPVERRADAPGPGRPSRQAWSVETAPYPTGSVAVPGWDVVLVMSQGRPFWLTAVATSDGEELWTYRREGAGGVRVTVDPAAGRILLTDGNAAVVLDLADGSEVVTRRLPHPEECGLVQLDDVEVSPWAPLDCRDEEGDRWVSLVEVSSGRSSASTDPLGGDDRPGDQWFCETTVAPGAAPVVVQTGGGDCRGPEIVASDPGPDDFRMPATLEPPPAWSDLDRPVRTYTSELGSDPIATDDVVVLALFWFLGDEDPNASHLPLEARGASEVVVLDRHGDVLWRRPDVHAVPTVTDNGLLVRVPHEWQLLSLADGAVVARDSQADDEDRIGGEPVVAADGEHLYTLAGADLVVRDLADLTVHEIREDIVPDQTRHVHAADGRLIFQAAGASLVAYEEARER